MRLTPFFACFILSIITSSVIGVPVPPASTEGGVGRRLQEETMHEDIHRAVGRGFSHGDGEAKVTWWRDVEEQRPRRGAGESAIP